ncbi:flagellar biosynthesis anti-sigma factor FlgM [Escherichia sp. E2748]|uniref:flagellar biosynthesis anti-sigma factor FlgM n=1 Tax=Escherichia sp. E2748 TaxID=2044460 RepID=UPI00108042B1|nr:flagellar biosynthesis anti-sigma factor FlgM [Escherichia sp. E2748]TGB97301.1 flagellar biosynthesis anti-sigma factor FlgM [Escherichia sp. E2748]TLI85192.1 flagellar biosynthesis anti-sigma factor FlgM [Escherichia sp. E2748]
MSIERICQTSPVQGADIRQSTDSRQPQPQGGSLRSDDQDASVHVELSHLSDIFTSDDSNDVDHARLAKISAQIAAGELTLDSDHIATRLVDEIIRFS